MERFLRLTRYYFPLRSLGQIETRGWFVPAPDGRLLEVHRPTHGPEAGLQVQRARHDLGGPAAERLHRGTRRRRGHQHAVQAKWHLVGTSENNNP